MVACALLNIGDVMLQQHSYKLDIQYWLNIEWSPLDIVFMPSAVQKVAYEFQTLQLTTEQSLLV